MHFSLSSDSFNPLVGCWSVFTEQLEIQSFLLQCIYSCSVKKDAFWGRRLAWCMAAVWCSGMFCLRSTRCPQGPCTRPSIAPPPGTSDLRTENKRHSKGTIYSPCTLYSSPSPMPLLYTQHQLSSWLFKEFIVMHAKFNPTSIRG